MGEFNDYTPNANSIDPVNDLLLEYQNSSGTLKNINRNTFLALSSAPLGLTDAQSPTNKTFNNTNIITIKDSNFTIQNASSATKQALFSAASITAGQTRTITIPDASGTLGLLGSTQTWSGVNTFSGSSWTGGTISNASISSDTITGFSSSTSGNIYGIAVTSGVITGTSTISTAALTNSSVTPSKLATGATQALTSGSSTTTNTAYALLADSISTAATVTIGVNGLALVSIYSYLANGSSGGESFVGFAVSGSSTVAATDTAAIQFQAFSTNAEGSYGATFLVTGLTSGSNVFTLQYKVGTSQTGTFKNRRIAVVPL